MYLIAGATGAVGSAMCRQLSAAGLPFRALVRPEADSGRYAEIKRLGGEIAEGDLKDRASLDAACKGATAVISTVSSTLSTVQGDNIASVDRDGTFNLIAAAEGAGVERFGYLSFASGIGSESPLNNAKREVEKRLADSKLGYTVLRPAFYMERTFIPLLGFDVANGTAVVYGSGENKISYISVEDVAHFAIAAMQSRLAARHIFEIGGPEALTQIEAITIFEELTGKTFQKNFVPEEALRAQIAQATDPKMQSFGALSLDFALGVPVDNTEAMARVPMSLTSVRQFAKKMLASQN